MRSVAVGPRPEDLETFLSVDFDQGVNRDREPASSIVQLGRKVITLAVLAVLCQAAPSSTAPP